MLAPMLDADAVRVPGAAPVARSSFGATGLESPARAHLFGQVPALREPVAQPANAVEAPPTSLDLTLTGTLIADDASASHAIIGDGGTERSYRPGETLASGRARLRAIHVDHVILERDGVLEALRAPGWSAANAARAAPIVAAASRPSEPPVLEAATIPLHVASPVAADARAVASKLLAPGETPVANVIRFTTYRDGGVVGLRAGPGRDSRTFRELGLKAGDVITGVNGTALGDAPSGAALVKALQTGPSVNVSLVRDGIPQVVTIPAAVFGERLARR